MSAVNSDQLLAQLNWRYATKEFDRSRKISAPDWAALEEALLLTASSRRAATMEIHCDHGCRPAREATGGILRPGANR
jgi:hypothetical protein